MTAIAVTKLQEVWISIKAETEDRRTLLLEDAALIPASITESNLPNAVSWLREATVWDEDVETSRLEVKRQFLERARQVDVAVNECRTILREELKRVTLGVEQHSLLIEHAKRAAQSQARVDAAALQQQRTILLQKAREAPTEEERKEALAEADAAKQMSQRMAAPASTALDAIDNVTAKPKWVWVLTDIRELHRASPGLVTLAPDKTKINAAVTAGLRECPGLQIKEEMRIKITS